MFSNNTQIIPFLINPGIREGAPFVPGRRVSTWNHEFFIVLGHRMALERNNNLTMPRPWAVRSTANRAIRRTGKGQSDYGEAMCSCQSTTGAPGNILTRYIGHPLSGHWPDAKILYTIRF